MARIEEITGGSAVYPMAAGTFTKVKKGILGFIPQDTCNVTAITYENGVTDYDTKFGQTYTGCNAGIYYHFPAVVTKATFSVNVDLIFE